MAGIKQNKIMLLAAEGPDRDLLLNMLAGHGDGVEVRATVEDLIVSLPSDVSLLVVARDLESEERRKLIAKIVAADDFSSLPVLVVVKSSDQLVEWLDGYEGILDSIRWPVERERLLARSRTLINSKEQSDELAIVKERLQESQRMECLGAIAAGVVHEFNNLMFALMGFAEIAKVDANNVEALRECADVAYQVAKRASSIAGSLMAMSKKVRSAETYGSLNDVVKDTLKLMKRHLEGHRVEVQIVPGDIPPTKYSYGPIQQVLVNLFINAIQAMDANQGERVLRVTTAKEDSGRIVVSVQDNGHGIPEELMEKLFTPFFTTKTAGEEGSVGGSGLGLSIVKEVVKNHNGVVLVDSKEGNGTTFRIVLPVVSDTAADELPAKAVEKPVLGAMKPCSILVIDDEESNRKMIMRGLMKSGYDVYAAASVPEAMGLFWSGKIDLIIMDLIMPQINGVQCVNFLRDDGIEIPILLCTGMVGSPLIQDALNAGANEVLQKPFTSQQLLESVARCLTQKGRPKQTV